MIETLFEPFQFAFFRHGLVVAMLAGALCGMIGVYVVLRGMSYIGHGLSHAIFGGAAASSVVSFNYYIGAGVWGIVSALIISRVTRRRVIGSDAAIGVITTASFALGLAVFARFGAAEKSIDAVLFGSILGVTVGDIWVIAVVTLGAAAMIFLCYRALLFTTFDPEVAEVSGINAGRIDALLMLILAVSILVTMKVIGVLLIAAMLVIPPSTARMATNSFARMLGISTVLGSLCGFVGMYLSYHLDISPGAGIVLIGAAIFAGVWTFGSLHLLRRRPGSLWGRLARTV